MARVADELRAIVADLGRLEHRIADALAGDGTRRLAPGQIRALQDLDRATQTLENLHRVVGGLAERWPEALGAREIDGLVTLGRLAARLGGHAPPGPQAAGDDEVTWL